MRLKDQHATAYLAGQVDTTVLDALWGTAAAAGDVRVENATWVLDDRADLTDDTIDGLRITVDLGHGSWLTVRVSNRSMLTIDGGTGADAHQLCAELVTTAVTHGFSAHHTWDAAWEANRARTRRRSLLDHPAVIAGWVTLATGTVTAAFVAAATPVPFTHAALVADAAAVLVAGIVWAFHPGR